MSQQRTIAATTDVANQKLESWMKGVFDFPQILASFFPGFLHALSDRALAWYSTVDGQNYLPRGIFPHGKLTHPVAKPAKRTNVLITFLCGTKISP